jgi:basic membrane protein A
MKCRTKSFYLLITLIFLLSTIVSCTSQVAEEPETKLAAIFAGTTKDDSWNLLGFEAYQAAIENTGIEGAYSERVEVPDLERIVSEYVNNGFNIIWTHGGQYTSTIIDTLADQNPDVTFIVEGDGPNEAAAEKENVWYMDRNHVQGVYPIGRLAALWTESDVIGYIGGFPLPYEWGQIHAFEQALSDAGSDAKLEFIITGDYNDPVKGKQAAESLIAKGADVLFSDLDLGGSGVVQAVNEAENEHLRLTTNFTLYENSPEWITGITFDIKDVMTSIVEQIQDGTTGGSVILEFGEGKPRSIYLPLRGMSEEINNTIAQIASDVESGEIEVIQDFTPIE